MPASRYFIVTCVPIENVLRPGKHQRYPREESTVLVRTNGSYGRMLTNVFRTAVSVALLI